MAYYRIDAEGRRARTFRHLANAIRRAEAMFSEQRLADPPDVTVTYIDSISAMGSYEVGRVTVTGWRYTEE